MLEREEYVEQAHLFQTLSERLPQNQPLQEALLHVRDEVLATTRLPLALDFLLTELKHQGSLGPAMERLTHYFLPFQTYVIREAEQERGQFDMRVALKILCADAEYRTREPTPAGIFFFQFECLCRNRMRYDPGLFAVAHDPMFDDTWRRWILDVRRDIGIVDLANIVYLRSQHHLVRLARRSGGSATVDVPVLFGEKEGKIGLANRGKDPLYFFAALQRHLGYPQVPRPEPVDTVRELLPQVLRRLERMETRIKLLEDEQRDRGIDLTQFYK